MRMLRFLMAALADTLADDEDERSLLEGSAWTGDMNFRTGRFDCGMDPAGYYEEDL